MFCGKSENGLIKSMQLCVIQAVLPDCVTITTLTLEQCITMCICYDFKIFANEFGGNIQIVQSHQMY